MTAIEKLGSYFLLLILAAMFFAWLTGRRASNGPGGGWPRRFCIARLTDETTKRAQRGTQARYRTGGNRDDDDARDHGA